MDTISCAKSIQSNSNSSDPKCDIDNSVFVSSPASLISIENPSSEQELSEEEEDNSDYFAQFICPDDSDTDSEYFYDDNNDDTYIHSHLNRKQLYLADYYQEENYKRSKRSNKKMHAQRQIKTKYAKTIKIKSHNKQLYMHHRLIKMVKLDPPSQNYMPSCSSTRSYSNKELPSPVDKHRHLRNASNNQKQTQQSTTHNNTSNANNQFHAYTINENTIPDQSHFEDDMITFLLEMQNRDLSPNDYEILLRLDERIQRKTVDKNVLDKLPTISVNETHLNDLCTICIEQYTIGQQIKLLPCTHIFHLHCIETYLKEFSSQCPLDNLPLM